MNENEPVFDIPDLPEEKEPDFITLKQMLKANAARYAIRKAFLVKDENGGITGISYKKFSSHVDSLGTALIEKLGLSGCHIGLCARNCYEWCVSYFAISCGTGVVAAIDRETIIPELLNIIDFAELRAIIADKRVTEKLIQNFDKLPDEFQIICIDDFPDDRVIAFKTLVDDGKALVKQGITAFSDCEIDPDKMAVLLFTSGTTGMAKGVMLSHRNLCSDIYGTLSKVKINYDDSTLCVLPLHHAYQAIVMLAIIAIGGSVSFSDGLRHIVENLGEYNPTVFVSVPLMLEKMHKKIVEQMNSQGAFKKAFTVGKAKTFLSRITNHETKKRIFSLVHSVFGGKLRMIIGGAAMFDPDVAKDYAAFGFPVIIGYGLTECSPIVICNTTDDPTPDSVGKPIGYAEADIFDPDEDGIGEIIVKGPMVMLGYYKNQEETDKVIIDGWFHTGDLGYVDENGNYHITGRSKNVIVTKNGKNIYPEELEYYLNSDPAVLESLIFGSESSRSDPQVTAKVVPDEQAIKKKLKKEKLTNQDIQKAIVEAVRKLNRRLPSYKSIKKINIETTELEKTSTHKLKRNYSKSKRKHHEKKENENTDLPIQPESSDEQTDNVSETPKDENQEDT
ncbi:MAG: AMP-dependent synthetase/ligase [Acutalibacteraceae bacterium]